MYLMTPKDLKCEKKTTQELCVRAGVFFNLSVSLDRLLIGTSATCHGFSAFDYSSKQTL